MTCHSISLYPWSALPSPAQFRTPGLSGTQTELCRLYHSPCSQSTHTHTHTVITSSATTTAPAPATASAPEGSSHSAALALHAGGLVVVLPAALMLVVGVPACSTWGRTGRRGVRHDSTSLEQAQSPLNAGKLPPLRPGQERVPSPSPHL